jgi:hypothetical protein
MKIRIAIIAACVAFAPCALLMDTAQAGTTVRGTRSHSSSERNLDWGKNTQKNLEWSKRNQKNLDWGKNRKNESDSHGGSGVFFPR